MNKTEILQRLQAIGFEVEELPDYAYMFQYEGLTLLYIFDDDDEEFFRMVAPRIFDITEDNREFLLDIVNEINIRLKYSKTVIADDSVWVNYEHHLFGDDHIDDIIEHAITLLQATVYTFHRKINGDDESVEQQDQGEQKTENE